MTFCSKCGGAIQEDVYFCHRCGHLTEKGARARNGKIEGKINSKKASLSTSNGKIDLTLPCGASGEYELRTSNGGIELDTPRASTVGFDLNMRTSMGRINVDLPDLEYKMHRKNRIAARTNGFDGKEVQISIEAETSMGKIWLN